MGFYDTKKWASLRARALRRDGYRDQIERTPTPATEVHHIFPREIYPQYETKMWNLISLTHDNHNRMHNHVNGELSNLGRSLMMKLAQERGIHISRTYLVVGLPGAGKTTYVKQHLGNGVAYDLDYIAAAFRLTAPKKEQHTVARRMANTMAQGFVQNARKYGGDIFIIRTAPTVNEALGYEPDRIVVIGNEVEGDWSEHRQRINELIAFAKANDIDVVDG